MTNLTKHRGLLVYIGGGMFTFLSYKNSKKSPLTLHSTHSSQNHNPQLKKQH